LENLGVALFGASADDVVIGIMEIEKKLGFLLPKVFPIPPETSLKDAEKYKYFNRLKFSNEYQALSIIETFRHLGWRKYTWIQTGLTALKLMA
jgi:hypothetical protein